MFFSAALPAFLLFSVNPFFVAANRRPSHVQYGSDKDINNYRNVRYTAGFSIGGKTVNVILDTGSTDLWLNPPDGVGTFESTGVSHEITYGQGDTFVNGTVGLAEMTVAGHTIPRQAFINVTQIAGLDECGSGLCGLVGPRSVLSSIFDMNPSKGRFFAFSLYDPKYAALEDLFDGATINGAPIPWTANDPATPSGQHVVLFDTGTTNILMKPEIRDAIYSAIPGAVLALELLALQLVLERGPRSLDRALHLHPSASAQSSGQSTPHFTRIPLTLFQRSTDRTASITRTVVGSVTNGGTISSGSTDATFGDSFMRNVYSVFSFGDNTTATPYIQLMSQTNEWESAQDFAHVRQQQLASGPTEIHPADLVRLFDGVSAGSSGTSSGSASAASASASGGGFAFTGNFSSPSGSASECPSVSGSGSAKVLAGNLVADSAVDATTISKYGPIIIGLLAANLLIVLVLAFLGVMSFVRGRRSVGPTRVHYVPTKTKDDSLLYPSFAEDRPYSDN
ncbi:aspartic peptidase domain-containing protein [Mycena olivaceomarginata]|nr:aspartic peptidase domain-containing protein [Mycena olivaceomarginata]